MGVDNSSIFSIIEQSFNGELIASLQSNKNNQTTKLSRSIGKSFFFSSRKYWAFFSLILSFAGFYLGALLGKQTNLPEVREVNLYAAIIYSLSFLLVATAGGLFERSVRTDFQRASKRLFSSTAISGLLTPALLLFGLFLPIGRYSAIYGCLGAFLFVAIEFFILAILYRTYDLTVFFIGPNTEVSAEIKKYVVKSLRKNVVHLDHESLGQSSLSFQEAYELLIDSGSGDLIVTGIRDTSGYSSMLAVRAIQSGFRVITETVFFAELFNRYPIENLSLDRIVAEGFALPNAITRTVKRILDILFAITLLILSIPLFLIAPLLIKMDSPGPIFFHQKREGQSGQHFWMHKFRTMTWEGQTVDDLSQAQLNDPRITKIGRVLRKLHLDEFPQLFNVLRGEMSFVGPRPEISDVGERMAELLPAFQIRQMCRPGLTGLAAISQGKTLFQKDEMSRKLSYDLYYIKHCNLAMDIWILLRTAGSLMKGTW